MGGVDSGTSSGGDAVRRATATLLLDRSDADERVVTGRLDVPPEEMEALVVTVDRSVRDVVADWRADDGRLPAAFGLVTFAEFDRSAAAAEGPSRRSLPGSDITLTSMSDPGNLQRLGTAVTLYLDDWTDSDRKTLVYVDALAPLVDAGDLESTFQFLHLLVQSVEQLGATLVVGVDPTATDEQTINTLGSLFDEVIDPDGGDAAAPTFDVDTIHDLLGNARRRFVLDVLFEESAVGLERLATRLACSENDTDDPTSRERDRAVTALASIHLPRLVDAGVVTFDRESGWVRLTSDARDADRLASYLERSVDD
jgi:hypothetical protein